MICVGGTLLAYSADFRLLDLTFIVGALLAVFGAALVTQRYTMILDRLKGTWSYGGDVFFVIPFKGHGLLQDVGPARITRRASNPGEHDRGAPIITHPVIVEAKKMDGTKTELQFGKYWSIEKAREISSALAVFLNRPIQDESKENPT